MLEEDLFVCPVEVVLRRSDVDLDCLELKVGVDVDTELGCEVDKAQYLVDSTWISPLLLLEPPKQKEREI